MSLGSGSRQCPQRFNIARIREVKGGSVDCKPAQIARTGPSKYPVDVVVHELQLLCILSLELIGAGDLHSDIFRHY
jgi:hypothetical protein